MRNQRDDADLHCLPAIISLIAPKHKATAVFYVVGLSVFSLLRAAWLPPLPSTRLSVCCTPLYV